MENVKFKHKQNMVKITKIVGDYKSELDKARKDLKGAKVKQWKSHRWKYSWLLNKRLLSWCPKATVQLLGYYDCWGSQMIYWCFLLQCIWYLTFSESSWVVPCEKYRFWIDRLKITDRRSQESISEHFSTMFELYFKFSYLSSTLDGEFAQFTEVYFSAGFAICFSRNKNSSSLCSCISGLALDNETEIFVSV